MMIDTVNWLRAGADEWLPRALRALVYLVGAGVLSLLIAAVLRRFHRLSAQLIRERGGAAEEELEKQASTLAVIVRRVVYFLVWAVAITLALKEFNFDVAPLLAGAGVAGIAIGFAAQNILKDWINGFFLLTEGYIRINDVVRIGQVSGTVEQLTLRTMTLRDFDGTVHVFSNSVVQSFSNLTLSYSYYVFELAVDFREDPDRMTQLLNDTVAEMRGEAEYAGLILEPAEIAGVDRFTEQGVMLKARLRTRPGSQWKVGREVNRRLKARCDAAGVTIATARRAVQIVEKGKEAADAPDRSQAAL